MKIRACYIRIITVSILITIFTSVSAQKKTDTAVTIRDTTAYVTVTTMQGTKYNGKMIDNRNDTVTLVTSDIGTIRIPLNSIKKIDKIDMSRVTKGKYWFPNPLPGRYFFAPSAFSLKKGEGYYQNTMIALNSFNVGLTNWFSIGGGIEFFTTFVSLTQGEFMPTFFITPKVGVEVAKNVHLGAGFLYMQVLGDLLKLGTFYGVFSYGNSDYNFSTGLGWGFGSNSDNEGNWSFEKSPLITICGLARVSRRIALVTENWIIPGGGENGGYYPLFSYGLRFLGESMSVDLVLVNSKDIAQGIFIGIPLVAFTVKF